MVSSADYSLTQQHNYQPAGVFVLDYLITEWDDDHKDWN